MLHMRRSARRDGRTPGYPSRRLAMMHAAEGGGATDELLAFERRKVRAAQRSQWLRIR